MTSHASAFSKGDVLQEPGDFSLVLAGPSFDLLKRRMIVITLVAWLPLLLLTAIEGQTVGTAIRLLLRQTALNLPQQEVTR